MTAYRVIGRVYLAVFGVWCVGVLVVCVGMCGDCLGCFPVRPLPQIEPTASPKGMSGATWEALTTLKILAMLLSVVRFALTKAAFPFLTTENQLREDIANIDRYFASLGI